MRIEDIRNRATVNAIRKHNVDISLFENIEQIRNHLKCLKLKRYRETHKDYFRDYMYQRCGMKKNLEWIQELPNV
jgi:hypothetical protein